MGKVHGYTRGADGFRDFSGPACRRQSPPDGWVHTWSMTNDGTKITCARCLAIIGPATPAPKPSPPPRTRSQCPHCGEHHRGSDCPELPEHEEAWEDEREMFGDKLSWGFH